MMWRRRTFLGGAGAAVGLPWLESLAPRPARAAAPTQPRRLLFYYVPNGIHMPAWTPSTEGADFALKPIMESLEPVRGEFSVLSGLDNRPAIVKEGGDHARGTSAFLTCETPKKTFGADIQIGISIDQIAARRIGTDTRLPSLEIGINGNATSGNCDSGYSCAYSSNISWSSPSTPLPKLVKPRAVFDRLFQGLDPGATAIEQERRRNYRQSVLDYARGEAQRLQPRLGRGDRRKLDEYLTSVRDLESQIGKLAGVSALAGTAGPPPADGTPDFPEHVKLMSDLMVLAFQSDQTRVITFMLGGAASGRTFPFLGINDGHHNISHHMRKPENFAMLEKIGIWEVQQLSYMLQKMKAIKEGDRTLLDNSLVFFSSEIEDGDAHRHTNLPVILAGRGGGVTPGRHIVSKGAPIANLFVAMLVASGAPITSFGDSNGALAL